MDIIVDKQLAKNSNGLVEFLLTKIACNYSYELKVDAKFPREYHAIEKSSIFFMESYVDLGYINFYYALLSAYPHEFRFVIYIHNCTFKDLYTNELLSHKMLSIYHGRIELFEYILINTGQALHLLTIEWFTPHLCNQAEYIVLNTFIIPEKRWKQEFKSYQKFENFYGCELTMLIPCKANMFGRIDYGNDDFLSSKGTVPDIFKAMSKKFNFLTSFQPADFGYPQEPFDRLPKIKKYMLPIDGEIKKPLVFYDVIQLSSIEDTRVHLTAPITCIKNIIIVTPGELYTPYEKMILPFDRMTWIFLITTFTIAIMSILIINQCTKRVQEIVYGNSDTPTLNVLRIFFGIAIVTLPNKDFARKLYILFVMFCLIFRTCYQSKFFEFLTSERRQDPPKTVDDLIARNYTLHFGIRSIYIEEAVLDDVNQW